MKYLAINEKGQTVAVEPPKTIKGCYYPKGFVIQFSDEDVLIDFIMQLPDDVWDYWGESTTAVYFVKAYYYILEE
nr:MAG: hypothetical protein [Microvirus Sku122]